MAQYLGRYELLRPIGRGGMAEVWLAKRRGAGGIEKQVVIKRILRERVRDPRFLDMFVHEARISMSLAHKNIVPMFDFGRVDDELFLVMEFIDGPSLALALDCARRHSRPPSSILVAHIIFEACQALSFAHRYKDSEGKAQRIAHRDVTPGNLLLSFAGEVKLGDFGLAAATADIVDGSGKARGTPGYMAPEQARGEVVGPAADIFSLGVVMWEALSGSRVRTGSVEEQVATAKTQAVPMVDEAVPERLREIACKASHLDPEQRFESARAFASALDGYLLKARGTQTDDPRPLPERLSDWLHEVLPEGIHQNSVQGSAVQGAASTFLEDGLEGILGGGGATLRSIAATIVGDAETKETDTKEAEPEEAEPVETQTKTKAKPTRLLVALTILLGGGAGWLALASSDDKKEVLNQSASTDAQPISIDASPIDAGSVVHDAQLADAQLADAAIDAHRRGDTKREPKATTTLKISSSPWAKVKVLGRSESCQETPCVLKLPPGTYRLVFENPVANLKKSVSVTTTTDKPAIIHEVLQPIMR